MPESDPVLRHLEKMTRALDRQATALAALMAQVHEQALRLAALEERLAALEASQPHAHAQPDPPRLPHPPRWGARP